MIQLLKKLFGGGDDAEVAVKSEPNPPAKPAKPAKVEKKDPPTDADGKGIEQFVDFVVCSLVDQPESVRISTETNDRATLIKIHCEKKDIGKIIGRKGKTISAIRALANGAGGRLGLRVNVEVMD